MINVVISPAANLSQPIILGFDPGRQKCGMAVMGLDRIVRHQAVVPSPEALETIAVLRRDYPISLIVMGDQTTAVEWKTRLGTLEEPLRVILVDERYTSLEARDRYWQMYPPQGWRRLLPQGLRTPPRPVDDIVAILLIERYLKRLTGT
ncbi:Holliday junction resolvase RuvX [Leptolyngbya sp. PCC 6406]|uniref:Holliday junction resolvase RuvX n=1 Tax=Leptolyngbya sp. PCC 6406 TaxID=1173264 RepID=UPI0002AC56F7|nr:Holliday junction resolvase RuvX [Leptolyngbya sp. PCC 6406]